MAHVLRITDYVGTVNFNSGNNKLLDYVPRSPNLSTVDFTPEALRDGGERLSTTRRNVTESALVILGGTSTSDMRLAVGSVETYLRQAEEYQARRSGSPVYMEFQPQDGGDVYRSEVLGGKVELSDLTLSASQWNKNKARAVVAYTRRHYWEGPEGTVSLYNSGGTATTGITVYNCNDNVAGSEDGGQFSNTGFETYTGTQDDGNSDTFTGWDLTNIDGKIEATATAYAGTNAVKMTTGVTTNSTYLSRTAKVVGGENRSFTFWTRGDDGINAGRYAVYDVTNSAYIVAITGTGVPGDTWTKVTSSFTVPATCTTIRVYLFSPPLTGDICYFDDAALTPPRRNYVEIAAASVTGSIPSPVKLDIKNTYNSGTNAGTIWVNHNVYSDPANFTHILEGEAGNTQGAGGLLAGTQFSGGTVNTASGLASPEEDTFVWALSDNFLEDSAGRPFRMIGRFPGGTPDELKVRMRLQIGGTAAILAQQSEQMTLTAAELQELGTFRLPPVKLPGTTFNTHNLELTTEFAGSAPTEGGSLQLDFIQISPLDGFRRYDPIPGTAGLAYNRCLIDDPIGRNLYTSAHANHGTVWGNYVSQGPEIMLVPGKVQRLYFLHKDIGGSAPIDRTLSVIATYRPRKLTI